MSVRTHPINPLAEIDQIYAVEDSTATRPSSHGTGWSSVSEVARRVATPLFVAAAFGAPADAYRRTFSGDTAGTMILVHANWASDDFWVFAEEAGNEETMRALYAFLASSGPEDFQLDLPDA